MAPGHKQPPWPPAGLMNYLSNSPLKSWSSLIGQAQVCRPEPRATIWDRGQCAESSGVYLHCWTRAATVGPGPPLLGPDIQYRQLSSHTGSASVAALNHWQLSLPWQHCQPYLWSLQAAGRSSWANTSLCLAICASMPHWLLSGAGAY